MSKLLLQRERRVVMAGANPAALSPLPWIRRSPHLSAGHKELRDADWISSDEMIHGLRQS